MMTTYQVIGVMSGSSLDGVDLAHCVFTVEANKWHFEITAAETIPYSERWINRLTHLHEQPLFLYPKTDAYYGKYLGQLAKDFITKHKLTADLISSHGHTIFHQPENGFTSQIGDGAAIHAETGLPVACNFRTTDVALGGQGAPLVPIGDRDLFGEYDACINLGGFANISYTKNQEIKAFDICPCNVILNHVAGWSNLPYDDKGALASHGTVNNDLLIALNELPFYQQQGAKSLGKEWVNTHFWPIAKQYDSLSDADMMATFAEHIAVQIANIIDQSSAKNTLFTGGGAFNDHLIQLIRNKTSATVTIPEPAIINFKEALIFAYLGVLRITDQVNCLKSVTGAQRDNIGGALYGNSGLSHINSN